MPQVIIKFKSGNELVVPLAEGIPNPVLFTGRFVFVYPHSSYSPPASDFWLEGRLLTYSREDLRSIEVE